MSYPFSSPSDQTISDEVSEVDSGDRKTHFRRGEVRAYRERQRRSRPENDVSRSITNISVTGTALFLAVPWVHRLFRIVSGFILLCCLGAAHCDGNHVLSEGQLAVMGQPIFAVKVTESQGHSGGPVRPPRLAVASFDECNLRSVAESRTVSDDVLRIAGVEPAWWVRRNPDSLIVYPETIEGQPLPNPFLREDLLYREGSYFSAQSELQQLDRVGSLGWQVAFNRPPLQCNNSAAVPQFATACLSPNGTLLAAIRTLRSINCLAYGHQPGPFFAQVMRVDPVAGNIISAVDIPQKVNQCALADDGSLLLATIDPYEDSSLSMVTSSNNRLELAPVSGRVIRMVSAGSIFGVLTGNGSGLARDQFVLEIRTPQKVLERVDLGRVDAQITSVNTAIVAMSKTSWVSTKWNRSVWDATGHIRCSREVDFEKILDQP